MFLRIFCDWSKAKFQCSFFFDASLRSNQRLGAYLYIANQRCGPTDSWYAVLKSYSVQNSSCCRVENVDVLHISFKKFAKMVTGWQFLQNPFALRHKNVLVRNEERTTEWCPRFGQYHRALLRATRAQRFSVVSNTRYRSLRKVFARGAVLPADGASIRHCILRRVTLCTVDWRAASLYFMTSGAGLMFRAVGFK